MKYLTKLAEEFETIYDIYVGGIGSKLGKPEAYKTVESYIAVLLKGNFITEAQARLCTARNDDVFFSYAKLSETVVIV